MESYTPVTSLSLQFLWRSALTLKTAQPENSLLLPVIMQLRERSISLVRNKKLDCSAVFEQSDVCTSCGNLQTEGNFKLRVLHHKYKNKESRKKLLLNSPNLSPYNRKLLAFFSKRKDNVMMKECLLCFKKIKLGLNKPIVEKIKATISTPLIDDSIIPKKNKKRKSKKDRFSGLCPTAVLNAKLSQRESSGGHRSLSNNSTSSEITQTNDVISANSSNNTKLTDSSCKTVIQNAVSPQISYPLKKPKLVQNTQIQQPISSKKNKKKKKKSFLSTFINML